MYTLRLGSTALHFDWLWYAVMASVAKEEDMKECSDEHSWKVPVQLQGLKFRPGHRSRLSRGSIHGLST